MTGAAQRHDRRGLCVPHRPAAAPRCQRHAGLPVDGGRRAAITKASAAPGNARPISRRAPCAGDLAAGARFLDRLTPFVWRKHLDFAAIQDAHDMRLRIREHKGLHRAITLEGHNMKLGRGRHPRDRVLHPDPPDHRRRARPVAAGARHGRGAGAAGRKGLGRGGRRADPDRGTTAPIARSSTGCRWSPMRRPMICPATPTGLTGWRPSWGRTRRRCGAICATGWTQVHELTEGFFAPQARGAGAPRSRPRRRAVVDRWRSYPALRSARAVEIFERLKPEILARLAAGRQARRGAGAVRRVSWPGCPPACSCSRCSRPIRS